MTAKTTPSLTELVPCPAGADCQFLQRPWWFCPVEEDSRTMQATHDFLLGLEDAEPALVAQFVAAVVADTSTGGPLDLNLSLLTDDPADFARFVKVHNWRNPELMAAVGELVEMGMTDAFQSERRREHRRLRTGQLLSFKAS